MVKISHCSRNSIINWLLVFCNAGHPLPAPPPPTYNTHTHTQRFSKNTIHRQHITSVPFFFFFSCTLPWPHSPRCLRAHLSASANWNQAIGNEDSRRYTGKSIITILPPHPCHPHPPLSLYEPLIKQPGMISHLSGGYQLLKSKH